MPPPLGPYPGLAGNVPSELAGGETAAVWERSFVLSPGVNGSGAVVTGAAAGLAGLTIVVAVTVSVAFEQLAVRRPQAAIIAPAANKAVCRGAMVIMT